MSAKPPTYRERAIDTGVNNIAGMRDLIIDLASEIDKLLNSTESPSASDNETTTTITESKEN